jgi:hypothetical protein
LQARRVISGRILQPLIRVVNFWAALSSTLSIPGL